MKRRDVLGRAVAVGAAVGIAGCISDAPRAGGADGDDGTGTTTGGKPADGPAPKIVGKRIETTETGCLSGSTGKPTVEKGDGVVRITGTMRAPTPCYEATFESASYDADADSLTATLSVGREDVDACVQCIGAIGYEATVEFEGGLPADVTVDQPRGPGGEGGPNPADVDPSG